MVKQLTLAACIAALAAAGAHAEAPDPDKPTLVLQPPDGVEPPAEMPATPEEAMALFIDKIDANGNGLIEKEELEAWVADFHMPLGPGPGEHVGTHPGDFPGHPGGDGGDHGEGAGGLIDADDPEFADLSEPSECTDELRTSEMGPQAENIACASSHGNEVHRTICNVPGYDWQAISLPAGRQASCFGLVAVKGQVAFEIVKESDGSVVWDVYMGKEAYEGLVLEGGEIYQVKMLPASSADARVTVSHIDYSAADAISMEGDGEE